MVPTCVTEGHFSSSDSNRSVSSRQGFCMQNDSLEDTSGRMCMRTRTKMWFSLKRSLKGALLLFFIWVVILILQNMTFIQTIDDVMNHVDDKRVEFMTQIASDHRVVGIKVHSRNTPVPTSRHKKRTGEMEVKQRRVTKQITEQASQETTRRHPARFEPWTVPPMNVISDDVTKILIVSHWRGGSTFIGKFFEQNEDVFYWFEPLISPVHRWEKNETIVDDVYLKDGKTYKQLDEEKLRLITDAIKDILDCKLENLGSTGILTHPFALKSNFSRKFEPYKNCIAENFVSREQSKGLIEKCYPFLKRECMNSNFRVVKVIRMNMFMARRLVMKDHSIKIIHYVRDPRGILSSRQKLRTKDTFNIIENAKELCHHMTEDSKIYLMMKKMAQASVLQVKYEDLASGPYKMMDKIYGFAQKALPTNMTTWIQESTHAEKDNGSYGTKRKDSIATALNWKFILDNETQRKISDICANVIVYLS